MLEDLSFLRIGFRKNPNVVLNARPMIGERDVNIQQVTHLIEDKILLEFQVSGQLPAGCGSEVQHFIYSLCLSFQRMLVLPNMENFVIPTMVDPQTTDLTDCGGH